MTDQVGRNGLRIVFVSEYFWPEIGGLERSTERLGAHLAVLGHPVRMVTQLLPGTAAHERRCGIDVSRWESTAGAPFTARAAAAGVFATADVVCRRRTRPVHPPQTFRRPGSGAAARRFEISSTAGDHLRAFAAARDQSCDGK